MRVLFLTIITIVVTTTASAQFWQNTDGPPSASTCMVTNSKGHVIVGTPFSKVYRTTDRGNSWVPFDNGIDDGGANWYPINQLSVAANDVLYAAVNGLGVLRSTNDGESWTKIDVGLTIAPNSRISISTKSPSGGPIQIFVGYDAGASNLKAQFSSDGGASFIPIPLTGLPSATSSLFEVFISPNSDKKFVSVAYNKGLFRTTDNGTSWRRIDNGDGNSNESDDLYATFAYDKNGHIYVGRNALPGSSKTTNAVVIKSVNDGEQWSYLLNGWDNRDVTNNRISAISFAANGDMWVTTEKNSGPFRGTNYGEVFTVVKDGLAGDGACSGVVVTKDNHVFIAPTGDPVHRHLDPASSVEETMPFTVRTGIMPNPASDRVSVTVETDVPSNVVVDLLNVAGERVIDGHTAFVTPGASQRISLVTQGIPQGVYTLRAVANGNVTMQTVVIAR